MTDPVSADAEPEIAAPAVEQLALFDAPATPASDSAGSTDELSTGSGAGADDVTIDDMAAEMDTSVPADAAEQAPPDVDEPDYTGICRGGPYEGRVVPCRFPNGFVLYDKQRRRMWTYGADPGRPGEYLIRSASPSSVTDTDKLRQAAEGVQLDVIAYDDGPGVR